MTKAELYLYLTKKGLEQVKGKELFTEDETHEDGKIIDMKEDFEFQIQEFYVEDENIKINGYIIGPKNVTIGWQQINAPMDLELAAQIIEVYTKKINRIKTIMQAVDKT